jgi:uncharacterized protein
MPEFVSPIVNALNAPFWSAAEEGQLLLPFCVTTEKYFWPPSPVSPFITSGETSWRSAQPLGVLRAKVIFRRVFQKAFEDLVPYAIGLVELDAGPRLQAHIPRPDSPDAANSGDRVEIRFHRLVADGPKVPIISKRN